MALFGIEGFGAKDIILPSIVGTVGVFGSRDRKITLEEGLAGIDAARRRDPTLEPRQRRAAERRGDFEFRESDFLLAATGEVIPFPGPGPSEPTPGQPPGGGETPGTGSGDSQQRRRPGDEPFGPAPRGSGPGREGGGFIDKVLRGSVLATVLAQLGIISETSEVPKTQEDRERERIDDEVEAIRAACATGDLPAGYCERVFGRSPTPGPERTVEGEDQPQAGPVNFPPAGVAESFPDVGPPFTKEMGAAEVVKELEIPPITKGGVQIQKRSVASTAKFPISPAQILRAAAFLGTIVPPLLIASVTRPKTSVNFPARDFPPVAPPPSAPAPSPQPEPPRVNPSVGFAPGFATALDFAPATSAASAECQVVRRRRRRKGKCREGFFIERPGETVFKTWRVRDCVTGKTLSEK